MERISVKRAEELLRGVIDREKRNSQVLRRLKDAGYVVRWDVEGRRYYLDPQSRLATLD